MRRILLLNPPAKKLYTRDYYCGGSTKASYYWPPLDLLVLSGILHEKYQLMMLDANVLRLTFSEAKKRILAFSPDIIISLVTVPSLKNDMAFLQHVKKSLPETRIIGSGLYFYFRPKESLNQYPFLDSIVMDFTNGKSIIKLVEKDFTRIEDVVYRQGKKIVIATKTKSPFFSYPVPRHEMLPIKKYHLPHAKRYPLTSSITNLGCPFRCAYCCVPNMMKFRLRDPDNVMEELRYIQKLGIKEIFFRDYTFTVNKKYVADLCTRMIKEKLDLTWICLTRADCVDRDLLLLMKKAGCHTIQFGIESGNDRILKKYEKLVDKKKVKESVDYCHSIGIRTLGHYILGLPYETKETVLETIEFAKYVNCDFSAFNIYQPTIGSKARGWVLDNNWLLDTDLSKIDGSDAESAIETPWLSQRELLRLRKKALRDYYLRPSYIFKILCKINSPKVFAEYVKNGYSILKDSI